MNSTSNDEEPKRMNDTLDSNQFFSVIARLLRSKTFRRDLKADLGDQANMIVSLVRNGEEITEDDADLLYDAAYDAFQRNAINVLSLSWDGDFPGMSGAIWILQLEGIYIVTSTDYSPQGPFDSLEEALACECFGVVTDNPELDSKTLPLDKLIDIAHCVVDWVNEGEIWINSERYVVRRDQLVHENKE